ncbi:acyltransferase family protein [Bifidobacterium aesculapii]|uniref:acyltransferase family protein n=1 Tax=Bifidobacterium aesculapii TaxID=1329411 RepID=UPI0006E1813E|nr:acyltransferase [Bifidobacterium aesculapii]
MKRRQDIVTIRALAILVVMLGHSIIIYSSGWNLYPTIQSAPALAHVKDIINVMQMPLFFSVSGFCLVFTLSSKRGVSVLDKVKRLLIPFLIVGLCWMIPLRLALGYPGYRGQPLWRIVLVDLLLDVDSGHLWFLPTLMLMFIVVIAAYKLCTAVRWPEWSFEVVLVVLAMGAAGAVVIFSGLETVPYAGRFGHNFLFFVMGYVWHRHEGIIMPMKTSIGRVVSAALLVAACVAIWFGVGATGIVSVAFALIMVACIYVLVPDWSSEPVRLISKDSMGLYLFHSPMLYISFALWPDIAPWLMVLINFVGFGLCALGITELLRRLHLGFVLGE